MACRILIKHKHAFGCYIASRCWDHKDTFQYKAPVTLSRIVVQININDIACDWRLFFSLKIWGLYRVYLYVEPERFDTMIICKSMGIRHELNTNWYDAVRCNKMQHDGDMMQYEAVQWWWRSNTIALWCDENTIGTNRNLHEPMRTCAIQYYNEIVVHRIATYWVAADRRRIPAGMYNESKWWAYSIGIFEFGTQWMDHLMA